MPSPTATRSAKRKTSDADHYTPSRPGKKAVPESETKKARSRKDREKEKEAARVPSPDEPSGLADNNNASDEVDPAEEEPAEPMNVDSVRFAPADDDSDVEFDLGDTFVFPVRREGLDHGQGSAQGRSQGPSASKWFRHVPVKYPITFYDYAAPVGGWYNLLMRSEGENEAGKQVMKAIREEHLVLATVPGASMDQKRTKAVAGTVGSLIRAPPPLVKRYDGSDWAWISCTTSEIKEQLLAAKIVWNIELKSYIVFRKPRAKPYSCQALQIRGVQSEKQWKEAKEVLIKDGKESGLKIVHATPKEWSDADTERKILIVKVKKLDYAHPAEIEVKGLKGKGKARLEGKKAPRCLICAGEDHHLATCEYASFAAAARKESKR